MNSGRAAPLLASSGRPLVFGIINVTPDSFFDGGSALAPHDALAHARRLISEGADGLDIGGESTRPGAAPISAQEELDRVIPAIEAISAVVDRPLSIDTMKPAVAEAAFAAGASVWNDVSALRASPDSLSTAARLGVSVVLMHMKGEPATMQVDPQYQDVLGEVVALLAAQARAAMGAGVPKDRIWLDPGIGFGKTAAHNLALLAGLARIVDLGFPVMLGASRKGFIRAVATAGPRRGDRLAGSLAAAIAGSKAGAAALRVHDVAATVQAIDVTLAIEGARANG
ncbi:MAG: dihydropteroate synthase [Caulobacteraceae bacterium]